MSPAPRGTKKFLNVMKTDMMMHNYFGNESMYD